MSVLLFSVRAIFVFIWIVLGLLSVICIFPFASLPVRKSMNHQWSRVLLVFCGVGVQVQGEPGSSGAALWVANHVSWVDIFVLNGVRPMSFIAKSDIRRWPIIGRLVAGAGTVFIERGQRQAIMAVGEQMKARFEQGEVVGLFPEGTTSTGFDVAPFHSSLFEAAIRANVDIQPVALRFLHRGRRSDYVAFVGEQNLLQNLWCLLGTTGVRVEAEFLPVLSNAVCRELGRSKTASHTHHVIRGAVKIGGHKPS